MCVSNFIFCCSLLLDQKNKAIIRRFKESKSQMRDERFLLNFGKKILVIKVINCEWVLFWGFGREYEQFFIIRSQWRRYEISLKLDLEEFLGLEIGRFLIDRVDFQSLWRLGIHNKKRFIGWGKLKRPTDKVLIVWSLCGDIKYDTCNFVVMLNLAIIGTYALIEAS